MVDQNTIDAPTRHPVLWYDDGNVVLQAEQTTFNVHRSILTRASKLFESMLTLKQPPGDVEGTEGHPIPVHDVNAEAFGNMLDMLYRPWGADLALTNEHMVSVLRVAHRLQFDEIREIAANYLVVRLPAERRLELGTSCGLGEWRYTAFEELVLQMDTHTTHSDPLVAPAPWDKVYSARFAVARYRSEKLAPTSTSWSAIPCMHMQGAAMRIIPYSPRLSFFSEMRVASTCNKCCGGSITQERIDSWYRPSHYAGEVEVIKGIWGE